MRIGGSIFLIAVGAILAFAVGYQVTGVDLQTIGWILMVLGAIGLILTLIFWAPQRQRVTVHEHRTYDDDRTPPPV